MPKPLSTVQPNAEVEIRASAISSKPQWAANVMRVIAHWAHIEGNLAAILGKLLKADVALTTAMYQAVVSTDAKRNMVTTAVENAGLREWQVVLYKAVTKVTKPSRDQRNDFAHGIWGTSKAIPDALLLMKPRVVIDRNARMHQNWVDPSEALTAADYDYSQILVYQQADFDRAVVEAIQAEHFHGMLYLTIGEHSVEQARRSLLSEPPIRQAIEALTRKSSPELQAQLRPPVGGEPPPRGVHATWDEYWDRLENGEE